MRNDIQECQIKQCTNYNSLIHNTSEFVYERHESWNPQDNRYRVTQLQPWSNRRWRGIIPRQEINKRRVRFEPRPAFKSDERSPIGKAITGGRHEAPTREMNIVESTGLTIGQMTITKMILEGKDITPKKTKTTGKKMNTLPRRSQGTYQPWQVWKY